MPPPQLEHFPTARADGLLHALTQSRGVEGGVRAYFERLRWPDGVECPRCDSARITVLEQRRKYYCLSCRYQFRVAAKTLLQDTHIPLWKWLVAIELMMSSHHSCTAAALQERIGGSYKTAWFLEQRIRAAVSFSTAWERSAPPADDPRHSLTPLRAVVRGTAKYRDAYEQEAVWKAIHPDPQERFRATVSALLDADPLTYRLLIENGLRATA